MAGQFLQGLANKIASAAKFSRVGTVVRVTKSPRDFPQSQVLLAYGLLAPTGVAVAALPQVALATSSPSPISSPTGPSPPTPTTPPTVPSAAPSKLPESKPTGSHVSDKPPVPAKKKKKKKKKEEETGQPGRRYGSCLGNCPRRTCFGPTTVGGGGQASWRRLEWTVQLCRSRARRKTRSQQAHRLRAAVP